MGGGGGGEGSWKSDWCKLWTIPNRGYDYDYDYDYD